ncbi:MAG: carbohydrate binding domain-containing protein [Clostridium sp.]|nr:carbohydrate binding domain-containing protein [Clostridium sp.]
MKTLWKSLLCVALGAFTFAACDDVPEPYPTPGQGTEGGSQTSDPVGDGTAENPFNSIAANNYIAENLAEGQSTTDNFYIKGKVVSIKENFTTQYGNAAFYISDDGTSKNQFYVYRALYLGNVKYTSGTLLSAGDEVVVCGKLTNYNGTYETVQNSAYVVSINEEGSAPSTPITGENILPNGDFETWADGLPTGWKSASTASSATLSQSTDDVHGGSYAVRVAGNEAQNKRLASKELTLKAGTYEFSFYAKSTTDQAAQCNIGYVPVTNGSVGDYNYAGYVSLNNTTWTQATQNFTLTETTTVCLVVMNPKTTNYATAQDILIDDATLKTNDGGIVEEGGETTPSEPGAATGDGTLENPFNSIAANEYAATLADNEVSTDVFYIKGKIASIKENFTSTYGNATFYISDDGTSKDQFYVYRTYYLNNEKYTEGDVLAVGDEVVVCGKITKYVSSYGTTLETAQNESYLYSWTKNGENTPGGDENPGGGEVSENSITVTAISFGVESGKEVGTQTLADGTVISFDGGGNSNVPKYYTTGTNIRMYPKNTMKITSSKKIVSIIMNCDTYQGTICNASGDVASTSGSVNTNDAVITVSGVDNTEVTISNTSATTGPASQIRMVSFTINYAE